MKGKFITFEGPEGGGKTTQLLLLAKYLKEKGNSVVVTREPGGTPISEKIRNILLETHGINLNDRTELLLMTASRAQNTDEIILPALSDGKIVLCDRYSDSTLAYQSYGRGLRLSDAKKMCRFATQGLKPDLTFLLDIDAEPGLERAKNSAREKRPSGAQDRMESQGIEFHTKVRNGFLALATAEPKRFIVLDGRRTIEEIHAQIIKCTDAFLDK
jgi:dTMP kinase